MLHSTKCRLQIKLWQRCYGQSTAMQTNDQITAQSLLSEENRQRCMTEMRRVPTIPVQRVGSKRESSFAAVLIAICTDNKAKNPAILYTRRSRLLSRHMRQVSFPGGIKEDDEDFIQCALRETQEEIGLEPNRVNIWGVGNLLTPPHTAAIMPVVGVIENFQENELNLNKEEVEEAFTIPITTLCHPKSLRHTQFKSGYSSPVFLANNIKIWGITGVLTNIFLNSLLPPHLNKLKNRIKYIRHIKLQT